MANQQQHTDPSVLDKVIASANTESAPDRFMRFPEVQKITGLSRGSIYKQLAAGTFPKNIPLGGRATGFLASEIHAWMESRMAARNVEHNGEAA